MRSTLRRGDRHTTRIPTKNSEDTNLGSNSVQHFTSPLHDDKRATTPRQQSSLRLTHLQCSQFTWSRNQRNVTSCHAADSVTFAERVRNSKSRPCSMIHKNWDRCSQTVSHCTFINKFVQTSLIPLHAHPDSHSSNFSYLQLISPFAYSLVSHHSSSRKNCYGSPAPLCVGPTISSSAVIIHCASCRIFCRTASDFLEACFVKQSDISHRSTSSQFHHTLPWP